MLQDVLVNLQALNKVQGSVEKGSFWQQFSAVLALRMTPVLPFRSLVRRS